jgi:hypothetical protein
MEHLAHPGPLELFARRRYAIMLKALATFLSVFWLLGLLVHLHGFVHLFGAAALAFAVVDQLLETPARRSRLSRTRDHIAL